DVLLRYLLSFPTRRSSDLIEKFSFPEGDVAVVEVKPSFFPPVRYKGKVWIRIGPRKAVANDAEERILIEKRQAGIASFDSCPFRSEEHTSELQSRENLVCR